MEASLEAIEAVAESRLIATTAWIFSAMLEGETLRDHVERQLQLHRQRGSGGDGAEALPLGPKSEVGLLDWEP